MPPFHTLEMWFLILFQSGRITLDHSHWKIGARTPRITDRTALKTPLMIPHATLMAPLIPFHAGTMTFFHSHLKVGARILVT